MRNLKKFLALVLAMLMIVSASAVVSASDFSDVADDNIYAEAIADLVEKGITNGVEVGVFGPDQPVERFQMALFMARALEPDVDDWMTGMQVFDDVNEWYGAIAYAYVNNIVTGMGNNLFAPHDGIRYQDALIMALRALGYKVDVSGDPYWLEAYNQAQALGLTKGVEVYQGEKVLTRAETAQIIYNMLYTTPADGGLTIAAKNFGEQTAANTTTMVVTATPEQYYAETYKAAQDGYLGLQAIVDGLPAGDVYYYTAEELGVDEDEIESYFGYAFDFVNFVAETGKYDRVIIGADPVVVYNKDVTKNADDKLTIDGSVYYTVDEFTGAALKNEIVILNAGELAYAKKSLYTDKDGNVVDEAGDIVADYSHKSSNGTKFYSVTALGAKLSNLKEDTIITEQDALRVFGIGDSDESYVNYSTLTAKDITKSGNYQMTLFDDDRDGKFERAIVTTVYVNAFNNKSDDAESFGPMKGEKDVVYTEDLTKGDVFTYTYNSQTKVVNVLDILPIQSGILTRINATGIGDKVVKLTIDGEEYTLANDQNLGKVGANIDLNGKNNNVEFEKIATDAQLGFLYNKTVEGVVDAGWNTLTVGYRILFYAIDDQIINAKTYDIEANYDRVVLSEIVSYDSKNIYVDLYKDGELEKNVAIASVNGDNISDLNIFQLSRLLSEDMWATGNIFKYIELDDGVYELSAPMNFEDYKKVTEKDNTNTEAKFLYNKNFDMYQLEGGSADLQFIDGIADVKDSDNSSIGRNNQLRTNDDTVFYFFGLDKDGNVNAINVFVGEADNSSIKLEKNGAVKLYADNIGYGSYPRNGVASFIAVYYKNYTENDYSENIKGFGFTNVDYSVIFVSGNANVNKFERISAAFIGLGTGYSGTYYSYDVDNLAVDMGSGVEVNKVYSADKLEKEHFYTVDKNSVVVDDVTSQVSTNIDDGKLIHKVALDKFSFVQNRYYTINGTDVDGTATNVSTVRLAKWNFDNNIAVDNFDWFDKAYNVYYITDYEDGSFVGIVDVTTSTTPATGTANATYTNSKKADKTFGAISSIADDGTITIQLYNDEAGRGESVSDEVTTGVSANPDYYIGIATYDDTTMTFPGSSTEISADITYEDGLVTIKNLKDANGIANIELKDDEIYRIRVGLNSESGARLVVTMYVNAD